MIWQIRSLPQCQPSSTNMSKVAEVRNTEVKCTCENGLYVLCIKTHWLDNVTSLTYSTEMVIDLWENNYQIVGGHGL